MKVDKQQVMEQIRQLGDESKAEQAERELPQEIDTEQDQGLLDKLGLDQSMLQNLGDVPKKFGL
jgi:hypothetical protein